MLGESRYNSLVIRGLIVIKKGIFLSLLCFLSLGFIFFNSSQTGSSSNERSHKLVDNVVTVINESKVNNILGKNLFSDELVDNLSDKLANKLNNKLTKDELNLIIRKCAHGFEFFLLSIVLALTFCSFHVKKNNVIIYSLFIVLLSAVLDEFFQLYIPGRNSSVIDVVIDFCGGIIGMLLFHAFKRKY
ncbi:VanZ family protein [Clostridium weizhouense]|uniref:VanZ family protein n=1 Tax=Clostridium weizhouense TaxID=2859781 RepID=A0ABS7APF2_9CLOT|nr:VanZ family protein [Clostridium weizhouense]MBW6410306.1 VanZ family protein [Clostridium weizhouense]